MKIVLKSLVLLAFLALVAWGLRTEPSGAAHPAPAPSAVPAAAADPPARAAWRRAQLWDDGQAEYCVYEVEWARYGGRYPGRALLILVKEPWAPELDVKADQPRPDGFDVLKLNHVRDVPTGIYTYHQMASVYFRRDSGELEKIAAASTEACGVSHAQMTDGELAVHSYFDGVADRTVAYPEGALPEDGLPALLRDYVTGEVPLQLSVFPSLLDSRLDDLEPTTYRLTRRRDGGEIEIRLTAEGKAELGFRFEEAPPHRLVELRRGDGTVYRMAKCERLAYWRMSQPGQEAWLPEGLRSR